MVTESGISLKLLFLPKMESEILNLTKRLGILIVCFIGARLEKPFFGRRFSLAVTDSLRRDSPQGGYHLDKQMRSQYSDTTMERVPIKFNH